VRGFFSCSPRPFGRYCGEVATPPVRFYGPNLSQATKVTVGIVPSENAEVEELRDWKVDDGENRTDARIAREILEFIEERRRRLRNRSSIILRPSAKVSVRCGSCAPLLDHLVGEREQPCRHNDDGALTISSFVLSTMANNSLCSASGTLNFAIVSSKSLQKASFSIARATK